MQINLLDYLRHSAEKYPDKTAFADDGGGVSFAELHALAGMTGGFILNATNGVTRRPFIIPVERSHENIAAMMGVLYSGNFYVPLDINTPRPRISEIVKQLDPAGIILSGSTGKWRDNFISCVSEAEESDGVIIDIKNIENTKNTLCTCTLEKIEKIQNRIIDTDPAYIIYTSGSTGTPKGIVVPHRAVIDLTEWLTEMFGFTSDDVFASQTPFFFDASIKEIYAAIKTGATVRIMSKGIFSFPLKVVEFLNEHKITSALWATSAASMLSSSGVFEHAVPQYLSKISFAGETLYAKHLNTWRKYIPDKNAKYVNLYGPTEATVDAVYYVVNRGFNDGEVIPIGSACRNIEVFLLSGDGIEISPENPENIGETGEICIRGTAVAFGYYGDGEKTGEVFVPDPRNKNWREFIYKTGDLARYNSYGELVFVSRADGQIKHMGARVELGDIEAAALSLTGVSAAVCIHDAAKERIVLIYTGNNNAGNIGENNILRELRVSLPAYMCPGEAIYLEAMPMTQNGKADRVLLNKNYKDGLYAKNRQD